MSEVHEYVLDVGPEHAQAIMRLQKWQINVPAWNQGGKLYVKEYLKKHRCSFPNEADIVLLVRCQASSQKEVEEPIFVLDHGYMKIQPRGEDKITMLIGVKDGNGIALQLPFKGGSAYAKCTLTEHLTVEGRIGGVALRVDPKKAVYTVAKPVAKDNRKVRVQKTPKAFHQSNLPVEGFVQSVQGMARSLLAHIKSRYGIKIDGRSRLMPWLIRHSAWLVP